MRKKKQKHLRRELLQIALQICANIKMDHKRLLSCCVEILDSFNPRIHGVLEHLNTCLATKMVSQSFMV